VVVVCIEKTKGKTEECMQIALFVKTWAVEIGLEFLPSP
jgi:hypothetical protein